MDTRANIIPNIILPISVGYRRILQLDDLKDFALFVDDVISPLFDIEQKAWFTPISIQVLPDLSRSFELPNLESSTTGFKHVSCATRGPGRKI